MKQLKRGDKIFLDLNESKESSINHYLSCRDATIEMYEYYDMSGYGSKTRLFLCDNYKHEVISIIRQIWSESANEWIEEQMSFDSDSFKFLKALINNQKELSGVKYYLVRDI